MDSPKSKKRTLRAVGKDSPTIEEWELIMEEIEGVSDRSAAILMSAYVEGALSSLIEANLPVRCDSALKPLYERDGALSTFFSKIHLGYAMGLFDAKIMEDLEVIRRVRNAFAHARRPINFSTPEIVEESQKLKTMGDASHPVSKIFDWTGCQRANDYRDLFVITAFLSGCTWEP